MKKGYVFLAVGVFVAIALSIMISSASAHKYQKQTSLRSQSSSDVASAERTRSMTDCMQYAANFKSRGKSSDRADFDRQYGGGPLSESRGVLAYNYDSYTNILLDCSKGRCYCRCLAKQ
ncbi:MAG: hypothetical protein ABH871_05735 [Pseudomonadota bacterium]